MQPHFLIHHARAVALITALMFGSLLAGHAAMAGGGGGRSGAAAAAAVGNAGADACRSNAGKALYDCLAGVLDRMASTSRSPETQRALQTAGSQLRAAANKAQALSAIAACRSAIAGIMQREKSAGHDSSGLAAITGVLATAARLIQAKG